LKKKNGGVEVRYLRRSRVLDVMAEIRERHAALATRLESVERSLGEAVEDRKRDWALVRGNGEGGLFGEIQLTKERVEALGRQWKWILGVLGALVVAVVVGVAKALLRH